MISARSLHNLPTVAHGFFTRRGGVSSGLYASLNCGLGSGDEAAKVRENRARAARHLGVGAHDLVTARQVHSSRVAVVEAPWDEAAAPEVDGLATRVPGLALGVLTADCAPVLFADPEAGVVGAAHAGWRGALGGVLEATLAAMEGLGARRARIHAAIGPTIGAASYEVGPEFPGPFLDKDAENAVFFRPAVRDGHFRFDLPGYIARRLVVAGAGGIEALACDTCLDSERFFSYRRSRLRGEADFGRGLSAIALQPPD